MSEVSYEIKYIKQTRVSNTYDEAKINEHYIANKTHFSCFVGDLLAILPVHENCMVQSRTFGLDKLGNLCYEGKGSAAGAWHYTEPWVECQTGPKGLHWMNSIITHRPPHPHSNG